MDSLEHRPAAKEADLVSQIERMQRVARQNNFFTEPDEISPKQHLAPQVFSHRGNESQIYASNKDRKTPTNLQSSQLPSQQ
jgi:hypothetical protein